MKQLIPTSIDEYIAERKAGDIVSGRVVELAPNGATVELGEGIRATCRTRSVNTASSANTASPANSAAPDLSALSSMLKARWKGSAPAPAAQPDPLAAGQVRTFKIVKLDPDSKKIEVELVSN
jgi:small subunit ribosomal protein S1